MISDNENNNIHHNYMAHHKKLWLSAVMKSDNQYINIHHISS